MSSGQWVVCVGGFGASEEIHREAGAPYSLAYKLGAQWIVRPYHCERETLFLFSDESRARIVADYLNNQERVPGNPAKGILVATYGFSASQFLAGPNAFHHQADQDHRVQVKQNPAPLPLNQPPFSIPSLGPSPIAHGSAALDAQPAGFHGTGPGTTTSPSAPTGSGPVPPPLGARASAVDEASTKVHMYSYFLKLYPHEDLTRLYIINIPPEVVVNRPDAEILANMARATRVSEQHILLIEVWPARTVLPPEPVTAINMRIEFADRGETRANLLRVQSAPRHLRTEAVKASGLSVDLIDALDARSVVRR